MGADHEKIFLIM